MEGYNPSLGCTARCNGCRSGGWVPMPPIGARPRRDPLIDAVSRMDDPCDRPARCPPCCKPVPKFRLLPERPICDINCYRQEQAEGNALEDCEKYLKCTKNSNCTPQSQCLHIESLDPNYPLILDPQPTPPPEYIFRLRDQPCRTNIIAGFFNPNDNKTPEQIERERCDRFYRNCGPGLRQYPCRGTISYPPQRWVSLAEEKRECFPATCEKSRYSQPEYIQQQKETFERKAQEEMMIRQAQLQQQMNDWQRQNAACEIPGCQTGRCGCD